MKVRLKNGTELDLMFGTDAEFFLQDSEGKIVPASRFIPGTKAKPHRLINGVCHPDGLSLEVGCPPSETPEGMLENLFKVLQEVTDLYLTPNGLTISERMEVDVSQVEGATPDDLEFGCGSEYNIRSETMYKQRDLVSSSAQRYSGFHIHLGYTSGQEDGYFSFRDSYLLVSRLDYLVDRFSLDTTSSRARQYGGRGSFRVKPYGIEYRCMDCSVLTESAKFNRLVRFLQEIPAMFGGIGD